MQAVEPSFYLFGATEYIAATHTNGAYVGPASLYPGDTTRAQPGEEIAVRNGIRFAVVTASEWIVIAIRIAGSEPGVHSWRRCGGDSFLGIERPRAVPVESHRSRRGGQPRQLYLRRVRHAGGRSDHFAAAMSVKGARALSTGLG